MQGKGFGFCIFPQKNLRRGSEVTDILFSLSLSLSLSLFLHSPNVRSKETGPRWQEYHNNSNGMPLIPVQLYPPRDNNSTSTMNYSKDASLPFYSKIKTTTTISPTRRKKKLSAAGSTVLRSAMSEDREAVKLLNLPDYYDGEDPMDSYRSGRFSTKLSCCSFLFFDVLRSLTLKLFSTFFLHPLSLLL